MLDTQAAFALIAVALTVAALMSRLVERAPLSFPMIFLSLGVLLGARGLDVISIQAHDRTLETVGILSLTFVLFLDAVKLPVAEVSKSWLLPALVLGPGALLTVGLVTLAAWLILDVSVVQALLLGAILASTDAVVLRDIVRDQRLPRSIRQTLGIEAGVNDIIVLPIILVLIAVERAPAEDALDWLKFAAQLFVLGPLAGVAVGGIGSEVMARADAMFNIRREYQALYGVGLVLAAFVAGEAVGGDGFLSAFAAGLAVTLFNNELCDCFLEYGEATAEMVMLIAFVLFGAAISTLVDTIAIGLAIGFAVFVLGAARLLPISLVLLRARISHSARLFIGWFGPRGLNSLLLALLVVQGGLADAERLLAITGVVVVASVILQSVSATPLAGWYGRKVAKETLDEEREATAAGLFQHAEDEVLRITPAELALRLAAPDPPIILDVRSRSQYERDGVRIPGSIRVLPDEVIEWAAGQHSPQAVVTYCT